MTKELFENTGMGYTEAVQYLQSKLLYDTYLQENPKADFYDVIAYANRIANEEIPNA